MRSPHIAMYTVEVIANGQDSSALGYSHSYRALCERDGDTEFGIVTPSDFHYTGIEVIVTSQQVEAESIYSAVCIFRKWQASGLPRQIILRESDMPSRQCQAVNDGKRCTREYSRSVILEPEGKIKTIYLCRECEEATHAPVNPDDR